MQNIEKEDLIGCWEEKATEYNGEVRQSTERSNEWIFSSKGTAIYKYHDLKRLITNMENRERTWDIQYIDNETLIVIDDEPQYRIISLNNKKLVAATIPRGLIYHFEKQW